MSERPPDPAGRLSGSIHPDPQDSIGIGEQLQFEGGRMMTDHTSRAMWIRDWQSFDGMLLSMLFKVDGVDRIDGSAVLVAPGVALCAAHVIEPHREALKLGTAGCLCVGLARSGLQIWRLATITLVPGSDLAILGLTYASPLPTDGRFIQATLSTRTPPIGESLSVCGFRANDVRVSAENWLECDGNVLVCKGKVTQRYPQGRDRFLMPWPAVEIDCPAWGGMSGGPVFDDRGFLVGLVCTSISDADEAAGGPAFASLLWPALGFPFQGGWPTGIVPNGTSLHQLTRLCHIERREAYQVQHDADSNPFWTVEDWA